MMFFPRSVFFVLLVTFGGLHNLCAQDQQIERFAPVEDTAYVDMLCDTAWYFFQKSHIDSVAKYAERALNIARDEMPHREARASLLLAYSRHDRFHYEEAIELYQHHLKLSREIGRPYDTVILELNLARCFTHLDQVDSALVYFDKAYQLLDANNFTRRFDFYYALGFFFDRHYIYDRALDCRRKIYEMALQTQDSTRILTALVSLGFGFNSADQNDSAIYYLERSNSLSERMGNRYFEWQSKACMGICHVYLEQYAQGLKWLKEAEPIGLEFGQELCCGNGAFMALAYVQEGQPDQAQPYLDVAERQLAEITELEDRKNVLQALYGAYNALGESQKALEYLEQFQFVKDSMSSAAYQQRVAELDIRLKTDDLLQRIELQSTLLTAKDKQISGFRWLIYALLLSSVTALVLWYIERKKRQRKMREYLAAIEQIDLFRPRPAASNDSPIMARIEEALISNLADPEFKMTRLAQIVGTSQRQINRVVREKSGMSPIQLLKTIRIEKAKQHLLNTEMQVAEVAYGTGFSEPAYFTKVFKNLTGLAPREWRRQHEEPGATQAAH